MSSIEELVEDTIESFCFDFIESPYLCYTEHGLHALFYHRLLTDLSINERCIEVDGKGSNRKRICMVQKEYPMAEKRKKDSKRAHWDIAVLNSEQKVDSKKWYDRLKLNSVEEFGLNEKMDHVSDDISRICFNQHNGSIQNGFVVHLYRFSKSISGRDWQNRHKGYALPGDIRKKIGRKQNLVAYWLFIDGETGKKRGPFRIDCRGCRRVMAK